jgi:hypothetical protein
MANLLSRRIIPPITIMIELHSWRTMIRGRNVTSSARRVDASQPPSKTLPWEYRRNALR